MRQPIVLYGPTETNEVMRWGFVVLLSLPGMLCSVYRSVIGRECIIGADVILDGCYLWDGVKIGNGVRIEKAMVSEELSRE